MARAYETDFDAVTARDIRIKKLTAQETMQSYLLRRLYATGQRVVLHWNQV